MTIGANPGGATLGGTTTQTAAGGIGTFGDLTLDKPGTGYTLVATSSWSHRRHQLDVRHRSGRAVEGGFTTQPAAGANIAAGASTSFVVAVKDGVGNTVGTDNTTTVSLALSSNPGSSTLTCAGGTGPVTVTAGVATFSCSLNKVGSGYKVTTSNSAGLTEAASNSFNVVAATASQLVITTQPVSGTASSSATLGPITVQRQDASGNPVTTGSTTVNLSSSSSGDKFSTSSGGGATTTVTIPNNSSTANVYYGDTVAGTPTITLSAGGFTSATQPATINPAAATKLGFTTQPGGGVAGAAWAQPPTVAILDSFGNAVPGASASITVAITNGTPATGGPGTLSGTTTVPTAGGVATFSNLSINRVGAGYTLTASGTYTGATSASFSISAGTPAKLAFSQQPSNSTGGVAFATQPKVTVQDALGNTVTSDTSPVTLAITNGTPPTGGPGTLSGTVTVAAVNGVATFAGLSVDKIGTGYSLTASDGALTGATSNTFNITVGAAAKLAFTTQPGGGTGGSAWAQQPVVTVQDAGGNTVTGSTASITLAIGTNPGGGTLTCTTNPRTAVAGVDTFAGCKIDKAGTGLHVDRDRDRSDRRPRARRSTSRQAARRSWCSRPSPATRRAGSRSPGSRW